MTLLTLYDGERVREEQASVFWPILAGTPLEERGVRHRIPGGRRPLVCIALGPSCAAPARPKERAAMSALLPTPSSAIRLRYTRGIGGTRNRTGNKRIIGWRI